jgi:hypothetical protein
LAERLHLPVFRCIVNPRAKITSVPILLYRGRPPDVSGDVVTVYIYTIYSAPRGTFTHVCKKARKTTPATPPFVDTYSTSSVVWILWMLFSRASFYHCTPRIIGRGSVSIYCMTVRDYGSHALRNASAFCVRSMSSFGVPGILSVWSVHSTFFRARKFV